ncbi:MAG: glycosyltransferase family 2 protein [Vampirovibrionales bacterium]|nr:glycosyltransferase family 2 protein [Vampirovibrionales bacterium]
MMAETPSLPPPSSERPASRADRQAALSPLVTIVLLNYRGADDTLACLASLGELTYPRFEIVVVDNDSRDDSVERLRAGGFSGRLIQARENGGFSAGNNLGVEVALHNRADYVWLLNNDTVVEPGALTHLVAEAEKTGGLAGSLLLYPDRSFQQAGVAINWRTGGSRGVAETALYDGMPLTALSGASMLIPIKVIQRIGPLDERYFLYFEDVEYCLRAARKRYPVTLAIRSRVFHKEGASTGKRSAATRYYYQRNRLKVLLSYATPLTGLSILAYSLFRWARSLVKGLGGDPDRRLDARVHTLAMWDFLRGVNGPCPHALERPSSLSDLPVLGVAARS